MLLRVVTGAQKDTEEERDGGNVKLPLSCAVQVVYDTNDIKGRLQKSK